MPDSIRIADLVRAVFATAACAPAGRVVHPRLFRQRLGIRGMAAVFRRARHAGVRRQPARARGERPNVDLGRTSITDFVADAAAVARHLDKPIVIGHSMGGLIAQCLAERGLAQGIGMLAPIPPKGIRFMTFKMVMRQLKYLPAIYRTRRSSRRRSTT